MLPLPRPGPDQLTFEDYGGISCIWGSVDWRQPASTAPWWRCVLLPRDAERPEALEYIPIAREPQRLPVVLTQNEVSRLLEAASGLKWRTALSVAYGAGLRTAEVVGPKVADIDSEWMRIRVEQSKGRRDRDALLSPHLLRTLRDWWKVARPPAWLFPATSFVP